MAEKHKLIEAKKRLARETEKNNKVVELPELQYIANIEILAILGQIVNLHPEMKFEHILDVFLYDQEMNEEEYPNSRDTLKKLESHLNLDVRTKKAVLDEQSAKY